MPKAKITKEEYESRIKIRFPEEQFEILDYVSIGKPATIKCCNCGKTIQINVANNFLAKNKVHGCVYCKGLWLEREKKLNEIYEMVKAVDYSKITKEEFDKLENELRYAADFIDKETQKLTNIGLN